MAFRPRTRPFWFESTGRPWGGSAEVRDEDRQANVPVGVHLPAHDRKDRPLEDIRLG